MRESDVTHCVCYSNSQQYKLIQLDVLGERFHRLTYTRTPKAMRGSKKKIGYVKIKCALTKEADEKVNREVLREFAERKKNECLTSFV